MFGRQSKKARQGAPDNRTRGMRMTERLLPIFGPAQVGSSTAPVRPPSEAEVSRDATLRTELTRVVGPDGRSYVVSAPAAAPQPARPEPGEIEPS